MSRKETVPQILRAGARTYEQRAKVYGDNYKCFGTVMRGLFPKGLVIKSEADWVRLGLVQNAVTKLGRYCGTAGRNGLPGHVDSAHDLAVYAAMMKEMTK